MKKSMLLTEFDRFVAINYPDTSYAARIRLYLAKLHFCKEIDKVIRPIVLYILKSNGKE